MRSVQKEPVPPRGRRVELPPLAGRITDFNTAQRDRPVGGRACGLPKHFRPTPTGVGASPACLQQHRARRDPNSAPSVVTGAEASRGVMSLIERGFVGNGPDLGPLLGGGIQAAPVTFHNHVEQFRRQDIVTGGSCFSQVMNVKYDIAQIEKIPAKALTDSQEIKKMLPTKIDLVPTAPPLHDEAAAAVGASTAVQEAKARDDSRTYSQLLDLYSLHEFIVRKGHTLRNTPEFVSYRRSYAQQWGAIEQLLGDIERLLQSYSVPLAYIDGKKLANLARIDLGAPSKEELMSCIANINEIGHYMVSAVQLFQQAGMKGHNAAAARIQSVFKMYRARRQYHRLRVATWAARVIQRQWGCHREHVKTRRAITSLKDSFAMRWRDTMDAFIANWPRICQGRRTIIHLPSLSYPSYQSKRVPFYQCLQGSQLMRLADLHDPFVDIILVSPFKIEGEALQYYINTLKHVGAPNPEGRLVVLVPENAKRLPGTLSLTKMVLLSTKMMRCLGTMARGKTAYIVPEIVGPDELYLASKLNIPMLSTEPRVAPLLSTKSGQKAILEAADAAMPVGAYHIRSSKSLYVVLARFIVEYRDVSRWVIKIENESSSRGHAFLDVLRLRTVAEAGAAVSTDAVIRELCESAGKKIKIVNPVAYPDWTSFTQILDVVGGCVEAVPPNIIGSPSVNLFIEPTGAVHIESVVENIFSPALSPMGCTFPQVAVPYQALREASLCIGEAAFRRKVLGYMSIDFVVFERPDRDGGEHQLRMWAVDLDLYLTNNACAHRFVSVLTGATFDQDSGQCLARRAQGQAVPLRYINSGLIVSPHIGIIRHGSFFSACRQRGLAYDTQAVEGVLFHLVDVLLKGCVGAICIAPTVSQAVSALVGVQQLLQAELPREAEESTESNYSHFIAAVKQLCSIKAVAMGGR